MKWHLLGAFLFLAFILSCVLPSPAQQKGQHVPGQHGLNAGAALLPPPGFTFANMDFNHSADTLKNANAVAVPVTGNYSFWLVENIFFYAPHKKILGGSLLLWLR